MLRNFFASSNFLSLLRYWDRSRAIGGAPDWDGQISRIPAGLLPRLVIVRRNSRLIYEFIGAELQAQFGGDPTGHSISDTLSAKHAAYITDIIETTLQRGAPVFSSSILHLKNKTKITGRLITPFTFKGATEPSIIMSAHLISGDEFKVTEIAASGSITETERLMIAGVPEMCARLEEAGRYYRLSHGMADRRLADEWDKIATGFGAGILVPLESFREARC